MEQNDSPPTPLFQTPAMRLWLLVALNFACMGIFMLLTNFGAFSWLAASEESGASTTMVKLSQGVYTIILFLLPCIIFANAALPGKMRYYRLNNPVKILPLLLGVFALLSAVFFIEVIYVWNKSLITDPKIIEHLQSQDKATQYMLQMPGVSDLLLCLLINALIPAVAEELFFRGGVQQLLFEWLKKNHAAIFLSAAFFSFLHFDPTGFMVRFILGVFLGYLFYWSDSLRMAIAAHFAFNAFEILNYYWVQHYPDSAWAQLETTYVLGAISLVISVGALFTCRNLLKRKAVS